jgi:hypothetical protein
MGVTRTPSPPADLDHDQLARDAIRVLIENWQVMPPSPPAASIPISGAGIRPSSRSASSTSPRSALQWSC